MTPDPSFLTALYLPGILARLDVVGTTLGEGAAPLLRNGVGAYVGRLIVDELMGVAVATGGGMNIGAPGGPGLTGRGVAPCTVKVGGATPGTRVAMKIFRKFW